MFMFADDRLPDDLAAAWPADLSVTQLDPFSRTVAALATAKRGTVAGVSPWSIETCGWGLITAQGAGRAECDALQPLLDHRAGQAGLRFRVFHGDDGYQAFDTAWSWHQRHQTMVGPVDPDQIPYYLLLVGDVDRIPFSFQYSLDAMYGVGRVAFDDLDDYRRYANSVVDWEKSHLQAAQETSPRCFFFGPTHRGDAMTAKTNTILIEQLRAKLVGAQRNVASKAAPIHSNTDLATGRVYFAATRGEAADKGAYRRMFEQLAGPAVLFTVGHGMGLAPTDARQRDFQGGLVCADYAGEPDHVDLSHVFSHKDLPASRRLQGTIHFLYNCFGAGASDNPFERALSEDALAQYEGNQPFLAALPRALLDGGACTCTGACECSPERPALAVAAHVDYTRLTSFVAGSQKQAQQQTFFTCLARLLAGAPLGFAMAAFGDRYALLNCHLAELHDQCRRFPRLAEARRSELRALAEAAYDARNFVVLGDPAVRLSMVTAPVYQ